LNYKNAIIQQVDSIYTGSEYPKILGQIQLLARFGPELLALD
jgi:hypothetical protein